MERHYFGLSTLLASVALLIWSIGETFAFPQGPNVSMGSNPVFSAYSSSCSSNEQIIVVPSNQNLVITDIVSAGFVTETITLSTLSGATLGQVYIRSYNESSGSNSWNHADKWDGGFLVFLPV